MRHRALRCAEADQRRRRGHRAGLHRRGGERDRGRSSSRPAPRVRVVRVDGEAVGGDDAKCAQLNDERDERQAGFVRRLREAAPALFDRVDVRFVSLFRGWCGGLMPASDFAMMKHKATAALRGISADRGLVNGVLLDLHGAQVNFPRLGDSERGERCVVPDVLLPLQCAL